MRRFYIKKGNRIQLKPGAELVDEKPRTDGEIAYIYKHPDDDDTIWIVHRVPPHEVARRGGWYVDEYGPDDECDCDKE